MANLVKMRKRRAKPSKRKKQTKVGHLPVPTCAEDNAVEKLIKSKLISFLIFSFLYSPQFPFGWSLIVRVISGAFVFKMQFLAYAYTAFISVACKKIILTFFLWGVDMVW